MHDQIHYTQTTLVEKPPRQKKHNNCGILNRILKQKEDTSGKTGETLTFAL